MDNEVFERIRVSLQEQRRNLTGWLSATPVSKKQVRLELAAFSRPVKFVGGDYFDFFHFQDGAHHQTGPAQRSWISPEIHPGTASSAAGIHTE